MEITTTVIEKGAAYCNVIQNKINPIKIFL